MESPVRPFAVPTRPGEDLARRRREALLPLGVGMGFALLLTLTPTLRFMGWFLRSLFHETGHTVAAWLAGCPAFPAISLAGHAAAFHKPQHALIAALVGLLFGYLAFWAWRTGRWRGLATTGLLLWLVLTFAPGPREIVFLLAGHLGELAFAWVFLRRALTGDGVEHGLERPLYAGLGWYLVASNVVLSAGLAWSESVRSWYAGNGSFGLENDYLRVARHLGVSLGTVGILMALVAVAVAPLAIFRITRGRPDGSPARVRTPPPVRW